ncbi:MAG: hypothetical protein LBV51_05265 [Acholeplasmatales bacterium]|jgi:hypothetical protein|nr:hypothetical protein [Acholeplasmatales bacterium]
MELLKVSYDGSNYLGSGLFLKNKDLEAVSLKNYVSERTLKLGYKNKKICKNNNDIYKEFFSECYNKSIEDKVTNKEELFKYIYNMFINNFKEIDIDLELFIKNNILRVKKNFYSRKKRFYNKGYSNNFNYFVTLTYDDNKHTEESFISKLKKKLANYHTLYGWLYMGVFEKSPTGRTHFHGIFYIPNDTNLELVEEKHYSFSKSKREKVLFDKKLKNIFGTNDFKAITKEDLLKGNTLTYIIKYINKSGERVLYSRGLNTFIFLEVKDNTVIELVIIGNFSDDNFKYIIFKDALDILNRIHLRM